ncbi:MAG TPA: limonene-1,2-epoxide hydrolase family protein [Actinomycetota bacterium]|nr:limonene-1,2-epoxide hydrolase family protein [Actinomycetota bacterium]
MSASDPAAVVQSFIHAVEQRRFDDAFELVTNDFVYDNVPLPTLEGVAAARVWLEGFLGFLDETEWVLHRVLVDGDVVVTERTDRFRMGDRWVELPVAGVWELRDGKIALWRDYFDVQTAAQQWPEGVTPQPPPAT